MRNTHLVEAHIRMQMIRQRVTVEGEVPAHVPFLTCVCCVQVEPLYQCEMAVGEAKCDDRLFLVWPLAVVHVIDEGSPLYEVMA